ncbi:MAG: hypothetical protein OXU40_03925 [Nitrospira sp.]|nr:hypothetical protein [Nitrospira sp.]
MRAHVRILFYLVGVTMGVWCLSSPALGLTGDLTNDPAGVVGKYVELDKRGARLTAQTYEVVAPYVAWEDEPVWEHLVVIQDYEVVDDVTQWTIVSGTEAVIPVTFQVLGEVVWETATFEASPRADTLSIRIRAVDNYWRMVDPPFPPHVGRQRLVDFVKDAILQEDVEDRARVLRVLKDDLVEAGQ